MKKILFSTVALLIFQLSFAQQNKKQQDINAIKAMSGCYEVSFNFIETFNYSSDSTYTPSKEKHDKALEWVTVIRDKKNEIQLQHLLITGSKNREHIVKHWRQDWLYENRDLYIYNGDNHWKYTKLQKNEVKGQWTQKVYQVDDSPRYEGSATWVHVDGRSYWENTTNAPLPRRENTTRSDYNITVRKNHQEIVPNGWIHDQDNLKIVRTAGKSDRTLAEEKGYNTYVKVAENKCVAAQDWWKENKDLWGKIRGKWDKEFKKDQDILLKEKVNGKALFSHIFRLKNTASKKDVSNTIDQFIK